MGSEQGAAATARFYPPTVVASIVTALLLNATEDGDGFDSFEAQLESALKAAQSSSGEPAKDYARRVQSVLDFFKASDANKDLFLNAHLGVKLLLTALANTGRWSPCLFVSQGTIKDIFNLPEN